MIKLDLDQQVIQMKLTALGNIPQKIMAPTYQFFRQQTPIKTGNARNNTSLTGNTIVANYQYAKVLDAGRGFRDGQMRGSTQAPHGMTEPSKQYFMKALANEMAQQIMRAK